MGSCMNLILILLGLVAAESEIDFLMKYGYYNAYAFHSGNELQEAIKQYQRNYGLMETGVIDSKTKLDMSKKRCGNPDFKIDVGYAAGDNKWEKAVVTYRVWSFPYGHQLSSSRVRHVMQRAFSMWSAVANIRFQELMDGTRPDIAITFESGDHGDGFPFKSTGKQLAHAIGPSSKSFIHFDKSEDWSYQQPKGVDLYWVATHEIGHALGLHHDSSRDAVMYAKYGGFKRNFQLHSRDIYAIRRLYGR